MNSSKRGWAYPHSTSKKAHYFNHSERALCGKWAYWGLDHDDSNHESVDNCAECKRKQAKLPAQQPETAELGSTTLPNSPADELETLKRENAKLLQSEDRYHEENARLRAALEDVLSSPLLAADKVTFFHDDWQHIADIRMIAAYALEGEPAMLSVMAEGE